MGKKVGALLAQTKNTTQIKRTIVRANVQLIEHRKKPSLHPRPPPLYKEVRILTLPCEITRMEFVQHPSPSCPLSPLPLPPLLPPSRLTYLTMLTSSVCVQSDASLQSAQLAQETASEPGDWGRAMQAREEVGVGGVRSASNSQGSSPHVQPSETSKNHQEWVRLMQQRELDLQLREVSVSC